MSTWLLLLFTPLSAAEEDAFRQVSLEIYPKWYSQDDFTLQGNIGVRKLFHQFDWITYYVKPSATYALDYNWALHSGLGIYYTDNKIYHNTQEWRPFVGISHSTNFTDKWGTSSYFRAEERYHSAIGGDNRSLTTRLRLRFRNSYRFSTMKIPHSWHKLTLDLEGFRSISHETTIVPEDRYETRVTLGAERSLSDERKIRFELAWKYKTQTREIPDASIHTIFFKIQYFPSWGNKLRNRLYGRDDIDE